MKSIFTSEPTAQDVIGGLSLIIYSLIVLVTLKYVVFILIADSKGEGGTFALLSLIKQGNLSKTSKSIFVIASLFGASFVMGDGALTPAISVLGALEGIETAAPSVSVIVLPITIVLLIGLFLVQKYGTSKVSNFFSPLCALWLLSIAALGINKIIENPSVFKALNPIEGIQFLVRSKTDGFLSLGKLDVLFLASIFILHARFYILMCYWT